MRDGAVEAEVDDMQEVRGSNPCKGGDITYFCGQLWWIFVRSPLTLAVNLHKFIAFTAFHRKIMHEICGEKTNFSPLILHIFPIFSRPGSDKNAPIISKLKTEEEDYWGRLKWKQQHKPIVTFITCNCGVFRFRHSSWGIDLNNAIYPWFPLLRAYHFLVQWFPAIHTVKHPTFSLILRR